MITAAYASYQSATCHGKNVVTADLVTLAEDSKTDSKVWMREENFLKSRQSLLDDACSIYAPDESDPGHFYAQKERRK